MTAITSLQPEHTVPMLRAVRGAIAVQHWIDGGCGPAWAAAAETLGFPAGLSVRDAVQSRAGSASEAALVICTSAAAKPQIEIGPLVKLLCSAGDVVLFSAASPGQGSPGDITVRVPGFWASLFNAHGFGCFDGLRDELWEVDQNWRDLQNAFVYVRRGTGAFEQASRSFALVENPRWLVHPQAFLAATAFLHEQIAELEALARYQPFGRDQGVRELEARVDALRRALMASEVKLADVCTKRPSRMRHVIDRFRRTGRQT